MSSALNIHEPLLVNTLGHCVGALTFGILLVLFLRDWRGSRRVRGILPAVAAAAAFLWNAGSVGVLVASQAGAQHTDVLVAFSYSALSLLPAVLLHVSLEGRLRPIWVVGYLLALTAVALHIGELFISGVTRIHEVALWLVSLGFGSLTALAIILLIRGRAEGVRGTTSRITAAMASFLFAISFLYLGSDYEAPAWSHEFALHHAGIPLALVVLLQEYRFLLLDVFVRFLANAILAAVLVVGVLTAEQQFGLVRIAQGNLVLAGIMIVAVCGLLILFAYARSGLQALLTLRVFRRPRMDEARGALAGSNAVVDSETGFLEHAAQVLARFVAAERGELHRETATNETRESAADITRSQRSTGEEWVQAVVPIRLQGGETYSVLLGRRRGGRRYLSEDLESLEELADVAADRVEYSRNAEMRRLVSQAELRALQAQINPHFLFNCLNALYGAIPRQAPDAREMVLNLARIFRYSLQAEKTYVELEEELSIVEAYLSIERLRLGDRLSTEVTVDPELRYARIPVLSVQPLVENAVKHGVAAKAGAGWVRVSARQAGGSLKIEISDSGTGFPAVAGDQGRGVGLENVRRRLQLCYGPESHLEIHSNETGTTVGFVTPILYATGRSPGSLLR